MEIIRPESIQPLPHHATNVFKGVVFDVYQWQQKQFDGSFRTFEKLKRKDTASIVPVTDNGTILVNFEQQPGITKPFYTNPCGEINSGESVIDGAARELLEETGYQAAEWSVWHATQPISKIEWVVYVLIAHGCTKVKEADPGIGEKIETKEITFDEFCDLLIAGTIPYDNMRLAILEARCDPVKMSALKKLFRII